jgi:endoglucanase
MKRRDFNKAATAAATVAVVTGCGGGGGGGAVAAGGQVPDAPSPTTAAPSPAPGSAPAPAPVAASPPPVSAPSALGMGTNLTGMQTAIANLRINAGTLPNVNYTVPRVADVAWLAANGYNKNRLPIQWELLQPMLNTTQANAAARAAIGEPGAFNAAYDSYITGVLDAHAASGMKCILDLHNYCRYTDFVFQPDGSVRGLVVDPNPLIRAYTTDGSQTQIRIIARAPGATLTQSNLIDFWTRAANRWKDHPGFGGYGLMNEPNRLPPPGSLSPETVDGTQDLTIWAVYAQAAINAIRALDPVNPIYLGGNDWSGAISLASKNPAWPLTGANIIYEVHVYLDAVNSGQRFDFDADVALGLNAGFSSGPITLNTGVDRLKLAVDFAQPRGMQLALTETGMPIDDPRWQEMWQRMVNYARQNGLEFYSWNGGSHWLLHNVAINFVPGWHQNRTLEPEASGPMKQAAGISSGTVFDDGPGWAPAGTPITITVYSRGNFAAPVTLAVSSSNGGTLSKTQLTIPAGANQQDTFTFSAAANTVTTLTYTVTSGGVAPPPPRKVYSLADPVAFASTSLADAALAIIAKYSACKWDLNDGFTDYELGTPAAAGQPVRAVSDSGYGSSVGNAMEMLNSINTDSAAMGNLTVPTMQVTNGRKNSDHSAPNTTGFMCRKTIPFPDVQPNPRNQVPYTVGDPHFIIAAVSVPTGSNSGMVFQASVPFDTYSSELTFVNSHPQARISDQFGGLVTLTSPTPLAPNAPAVLSFTSVPGAQTLRVNSAVVGSAASTYAASRYDQLLIGWGFATSFPQPGFGGNIYSVVTGKGAPSAAELAVLERYLATTAGISL